MLSQKRRFKRLSNRLLKSYGTFNKYFKASQRNQDKKSNCCNKPVLAIIHNAEGKNPEQQTDIDS